MTATNLQVGTVCPNPGTRLQLVLGIEGECCPKQLHNPSNSVADLPATSVGVQNRCCCAASSGLARRATHRSGIASPSPLSTTIKPAFPLPLSTVALPGLSGSHS